MKNVTRTTLFIFLVIALLLSACASTVAQGAKDIDTRAQPTPTTSPLPGQAPGGPTDDPWKNFTSDLYGYTVNYPANWTVKVDTSIMPDSGESPENVTFAPSDGALPNITIFALTGMPPFTGYENCQPTLVFRTLNMCQISIPAGQIPATDLNIFHNGEQYFQIALQYEDQEARGVFDLFMRSFKFTKPVENSSIGTGWQSYTSKVLGYIVAYPTGWKVSVETQDENVENVTFSPASEDNLVNITINAEKGTLPFSTFLACETNYDFHGLKACRISLPGDKSGAIEQVIVEKDDARYEISLHHTGGDAMQDFEKFLASFEFTK